MRTRRTPSDAPRTPPPLHAGGVCTTPTLHPSPITHTSLFIHFHLHNPIPPPPLAPLVIPYPTTSVQPRARPYGGPLVLW